MIDAVFEEQAEEIAAICKEVGISELQLAHRVSVKPDTLRKVARGYQRASEQLMQAIRLVRDLHRCRGGKDSPTGLREDVPAYGTADARKFGVLLTDEEREGLMHMVRDKNETEVIEQIRETLKDKTISKRARFAAVRLWLEVLENRKDQK